MKSKNNLVVKIFIVLLLSTGIFTSLSYAQESNQPLSKSNLKIFVEYNLAKAKLLNNDNIKVNIDGNKIILSGTVPTLYAKKQAENEAHSVDENYLIVNNLNVVNESVDNSTLSNQIMDKIQSNVFYGIFDWISVDSNNGVVTLDGWVHLPWLKNQFQDEVEKIAGVKSVTNKIQVTFGPGEIGYRAARLIYNDPMFWGTQYSSNPPIHIIVNNGTVYLYGTVASKVQKYWAANIINFRTDAFSVENNLQVKS
jgi:osmotically-inducible protein OsmY